ncbi:MAG: hypothetical protein JNG84_01210 [Archangium sp.]|nr:hypothetical protein [Archangium sp.]
MVPAALWREQLAESVRAAMSARFAAVLTCPPGEYLEAQMAVAPETHRLLLERIFIEFLPRIETGNDGWKRTSAARSNVYAPLDEAANVGLARELHASILAPEGIGGLANTFLIDSEGQLLGWLTVGDGCSSAELLARAQGNLAEVAQTATATLENALALAAACGVTRSRPDRLLETLTNRERQIVRLVAAGLSDANIAGRLAISEQTVGTHLRRIYSKLSVHSRAQLTSRAGTLAAPRPTVVNPSGAAPTP